MTGRERPGFDEYFMGLAMAVRSRASCLGSRVGAVIVKDTRVLSTGYNGTPSGMKNCSDGGCERCAHPEKFEAGSGYDLCICVHAEQNCLLSAARFGISVAGGTVYTTMRPCFGCTKELLQTGAARVVYVHDWRHPKTEFQAEYEAIQSRFQEGMERLEMNDPDVDWARPKRAG